MSEQEIESLKAEVARLRKQAEASSKEISVLHENVRRLNDDLTRCVKGICEVQGDAYERIKLLEIKVYPELVNDLSSANKIVGFTEGPAGGDALDKRKP